MDKGREKQPRGPAATQNPGRPQASKPKETTGPGRVVVDSRGRNVWHFHGEPIDSTSMMLQRLDNPALALEPTRKARTVADESAGSAAQAAGGRSGRARAGENDTPRGAGQRVKLKPGKKSGGGFDPYNRS